MHKRHEMLVDISKEFVAKTRTFTHDFDFHIDFCLYGEKKKVS